MRSCTSLYSHQCSWASFFSKSLLTLVICCHFSNSHSSWCEVIFHYVLISISLMMSDAEHRFMYLLAMCYVLFGKQCLFRSSARFLNWVVWFFCCCISFLYILDIKPLSNISLANTFSHSVVGLFIFYISSFTVLKLFDLMQSYLFIFTFFPLPEETDTKKCS